MKARKFFKWIKILGIAYGGIGIALMYLQEKFIFHPEPLASDYVFQFDQPFEELKIPINITDTMSVVQFTVPDSLQKGVVLYFHGNMRNIIRYADYAKIFTAKGYAVWMMDYPGFGKARGQRTEQRMNNDAEQLYKMARVKFGADSILIYGKSFGTGVAVQLAAARVCHRLILETPYLSIPDLFRSYAPIYPCDHMSIFKFRSNEAIGKVLAPITIFHGTDDGVVSFKQGKKLIELCKTADELVVLPEATHNNCMDQPLMIRKLDSLLGK
jgi:uncharacterized protein